MLDCPASDQSDTIMKKKTNDAGTGPVAAFFGTGLKFVDAGVSLLDADA